MIVINKSKYYVKSYKQKHTSKYLGVPHLEMFGLLNDTKSAKRNTLIFK